MSIQPSIQKSAEPEVVGHEVHTEFLWCLSLMNASTSWSAERRRKRVQEERMWTKSNPINQHLHWLWLDLQADPLLPETWIPSHASLDNTSMCVCGGKSLLQRPFSRHSKGGCRSTCRWLRSPTLLSTESYCTPADYQMWCRTKNCARQRLHPESDSYHADWLLSVSILTLWQEFAYERHLLTGRLECNIVYPTVVKFTWVFSLWKDLNFSQRLVYGISGPRRAVREERDVIPEIKWQPSPKKRWGAVSLLFFSFPLFMLHRKKGERNATERIHCSLLQSSSVQPPRLPPTMTEAEILMRKRERDRRRIGGDIAFLVKDRGKRMAFLYQDPWCIAL